MLKIKTILSIYLVIYFLIIPFCFAQIKDKDYFKNTYNLDDEQIRIILIETNNLTKNVELLEQGLIDKTYFDYINNEKYYYYNDDEFKENYSTFLLLKNNGELNEEQISDITSIRPIPCLSFNIYKYRGNKEYKVQKILNKKNLSTNEKYNKMKELNKYKKASWKEVKKDFGARMETLALMMTGVGLFLLLGIPGTDGRLIEYHFRI